MQETLEALDLGQALEQLLLRLGERFAVYWRLGRLAQPGALFGDLDLIEVIADTAAIDAAQVVDSLLGIGGVGIDRPGYRFDRQRGELSLRQAVEGRMELGGAVRPRAEGSS